MLERDEIQSIYSVSVKNKYEALKDQSGENEENAEHQFENLRVAIEESNGEVLPKTIRNAKRPWMTDAILELMDDRRKCKGRDKQKYETLNKRIQRDCLTAKKRWMDEMCGEIEDLDRKNNELMYSKVRDFTGKRKCNNNIAVKRIDGTVAMEEEEVKERWSEYIGELFLDQRPESIDIQYNNDGPVIVQQEVRAAIESMKKGKAVGKDEISIEMIQAIGDFAIKELTELFNKMYDNGNIVKSLYESIFVTTCTKSGRNARI